MRIVELNSTRRVPVTPCQRVRLEISKGMPKPETKLPFWDLQIANPINVEWINLPAKGTVTFHPVCGADVQSFKSSGASGVDMLQEIVDQVKVVRDAKKNK